MREAIKNVVHLMREAIKNVVHLMRETISMQSATPSRMQSVSVYSAVDEVAISGNRMSVSGPSPLHS